MFEYDLAYYENLLEMYAKTAVRINAIRWDFVKDVNPRLVLDYGSGCGFFTLYAPEGITVDSYDIGTFNGCPYPQTGMRHDRYDLVCFWDVLEHVDWKNTPDEKIEETLQKTDWVAATVPILYNGQPLEGWKHNKPGEHPTVFTEESLDKFFRERGFERVKSNTLECPPREDILSVMYRRRA